MKLTTPTPRRVGGYVFHIRPLSAFTAARLSGDLAAALAPVFGALGTIAGTALKDNANPLDADLTGAGPAIAQSLASMDGHKVEALLKALLVEHGNISIELEGKDTLLTEAILNETFCDNVQSMFLLAAEVIKLNFSGFFEKLGSQFGSVTSLFQTTPSSTDTEQ